MERSEEECEVTYPVSERDRALVALTGVPLKEWRRRHTRRGKERPGIFAHWAALIVLGLILAAIVFLTFSV